MIQSSFLCPFLEREEEEDLPHSYLLNGTNLYPHPPAVGEEPQTGLDVTYNEGHVVKEVGHDEITQHHQSVDLVQDYPPGPLEGC